MGHLGDQYQVGAEPDMPQDLICLPARSHQQDLSHASCSGIELSRKENSQMQKDEEEVRKDRASYVYIIQRRTRALGTCCAACDSRRNTWKGAATSGAWL